MEYPTYGDIDDREFDTTYLYYWLDKLPPPKCKREWIKLIIIGRLYAAVWLTQRGF